MQTRTAKEYANIAFNVPLEFKKYHSEMTIEQCEEFVDLKNAEGVTFLEYLSTRGAVEVSYILRHLSAQKLFAVCQRTNTQGQPLLHQLARVSHSHHQSFEYIMQTLTEDQLLELFSKVDKFNNTIFHYDWDAFDFVKMKAILDLPKFKDLLNNIATLQNSDGETFLMKSCMTSSQSTKEYMKYFLADLKDETLDKLMTLRDLKGNNFLCYIMRSIYFMGNVLPLTRIELIEKVHERLLAVQEKCKTDNYYKAILALTRSSSESAIRLEVTKADVVIMGLELFRAVLSDPKFPSNELLSVRKESGMSLIFEILINFENIIYPLISTLNEDENKRKAKKAWGDLIAIAKSLFDKVPPHKFLSALEQLRGKDSFTNVANPKLVKITLLMNFLNKIDYIPCRESDPLKVFQLFKIYIYRSIASIIPSAAGVSKLRYLEKQRSYQFERFLFQPEITILEQPKKFCDYYQEIFNYQLTRGNNYNPDYLKIIKKAIAAIANRDKAKYPDTNNRYTEALTRLESMLTLLQKTVSTESIMKMRILKDMSAAQLTHSAEFCNLALKKVKDNQIEKLTLEFKLFQFMHAAAKKYLSSPSESLKTIKKEASEEKIEKITNLEDEIAVISSLDSEEKKHSLSDEATRAIHIFNCRIVATLEIDTDDASGEEIDETNYNKLQQSHLKSIKQLHKRNWEPHLKAFSTYIQDRATVRPSLFRNSKADYLLRKAYFDAITVKDNDINDIYKKLEVIEKALKDPRIYKGYSHKCFDILKLLKRDFETWIFLLEANKDSVIDIQNEMSNVSEEKRYVL